MMKLFTKKLYLFALISMLLPTFIACSSDKDDLVEQEKDLYERLITPELQATLDELGMKLNRGINPPNVEGYFVLEPKRIATTVPNDNRHNFVDYYQRFHDQSGLKIKFEGYEYANYSVKHIANGAFISGEGDKFSILFEETNTIKSGGKTYFEIVVSVFSAELARDNGGAVIGLKNYEYALLMKDDGGFSGSIDNGTGRRFASKKDVVEPISKETFDAVANRFESKSINPSAKETILMTSNGLK